MDIVAVKDSELERYVTKIMLEIGVPAHLKGYHYLRDAIILSVTVGEQYSTSIKGDLFWIL